MDQTNILELEALEKAFALQNSRALNLQFRLDATDLSAVLRTVYKDLSLQGHGKNTKKNKRHVRIIVTDLMRSYQEDSTQYLGVSLTPNDYLLRSRYNKLGVSYRRLEGAIRGLEKRGYIDFHIGYCNRLTGEGYCTRIRATERLTQLVSPKIKHIGLACGPKHYESIVLTACLKTRLPRIDA